MTNPLVPVTAAMVAAFAMVHLFIGRLAFLETMPRSRWLSFSGGVAVAYVFLHVLPDLSEHQAFFGEQLGVTPTVAEITIHSLALIGLVIFYGLERAVRNSRAQSRSKGRGDQIEDHLEWVHVASYSLLNILIGYLLLHRESGAGLSLALYFVAMVLHFVTVDYGMRSDHRESYRKRGRWIISAAVVGGWVLGIFVEVPQLAVACLYAFLAGGIVLNVLKEELPEDRQSSFLPFLIGAIVYSGLMVVESMIA